MSELTFKTRVENFWDWYRDNADRYYEAFSEGTGPDLIEEISRGVTKWLPGFAFVFGPGKNGAGHSFTLSGEGNINQQFLTSYWLSQAPELEGWTFFDARQPSDCVEEYTIDIAGFDIQGADIQVDTEVDEDEEVIDLVAWHPQFSEMDDNLRYTVFFIFLDEVLGETGAQSWIGNISLSDELSDKARPITELRQFVKQVQGYYQWEKLPPCETYMGYQMPEPSNAYPRSDTVAGATSNFRLLGDYFENSGQIEDPLEGTGASFVYLHLERPILPAGNEVDFRAEIEEKLDQQLRAQALGRVFGGATGVSGAYIDVLITDGQNSKAAIQEVMTSMGVGEHYSVENFSHS